MSFDPVSYMLGKAAGGGESTIVSKTITANGTYNASSDNANGYDPVTVNVQPIYPKTNFICNWDFTKPINNRGQSSYMSDDGTNIWSIDGWRVFNAGITLSEAGIRLDKGSTNGYFIQDTAQAFNEAMIRQNICISAIIDGTLYNTIATLPNSTASGTKVNVVLGPMSFRIYSQGKTRWEITLDVTEYSDNKVISAVKLEAGSSQTLYNNGLIVHQDDQTEIIKMNMWLSQI